ncbi:MAG TPA: transcriptional regulator BetI [Rhodobacteraceae bacterium]|nr:transcriptional regulator BetI [Paracoccaceae bacterium]
MPKLGMEPIRRDALIKATIAEIGAVGSLDVTVSRIAKRAGMSSALAHHYFGGKDQIFLAAMRHILTGYAAEARRELARTPPERRAQAILRASFAPGHFDAATIGAWMNFYVLARKNDQALRLWRIYQRRLRSNLVHALRPVCAAPEPAAESLAALIDGLYIRAALDHPGSPEAALERALAMLDMLTEAPR